MLFIILAIYFFTVLWYTVLKRSADYHIARFELFWSYRKWLSGNLKLGIQIIANMVMFVPFGFLMSEVHNTQSSRKKRTAGVIISATLFSLIIETLQLVLMRGLFEWDDILSNTFGAVMGVVFHATLEKKMKKKFFSLSAITIGAVFSLTCFLVCVISAGSGGAEADSTSREYCFQIDKAESKNGMLKLSGFAFLYEQDVNDMTLYLRPTNGNDVKMLTDYGMKRTDVNSYFFCEYDYSNSGFEATGLTEDDTEYEVMIQWSWMPPIPTSVFVIGDEIHYVAMESFLMPDASDAPKLEEILATGTLRAYNPDSHCWVYQVKDFLYWIADQNFSFEEDGTTYIQYQLTTTQKNNLPQKRIENGWFWDNLSNYFEKDELKGDFGPYRVMKRELPKEYSITSIVTGYYRDGKWIWKNYFRPIYNFSGGDET